MTPRHLTFVCNAIDDKTRVERGISTDSPAASKKVFMLCRALRQSGVRPLILSTGRGRQDGSGRYFRQVVRKVDGVPVVYLPFYNRPFLSELLSLVGPIFALFRLARLNGVKTVLFYNRTLTYLPALLTARILRMKTVLDLEDGEVGFEPWSLPGAVSRVTSKFFDALCSGGALLACSALSEVTSLRPTHCYYGTVESQTSSANWRSPAITVLFGGTVSRETGAALLAEAIGDLKREQPEWCSCLRFVVTGKGNYMEHFSGLQAMGRGPDVVVLGRTSDAEYREVVSQSEVGLALKPTYGDLANTTFPSKVVELANAGLLVFTTDISDVSKVLGSGALYLTREDPDSLIKGLQWIVENRATAAEMARRGARAVWDRCAAEKTGRTLTEFLF